MISSSLNLLLIHQNNVLHDFFWVKVVGLYSASGVAMATTEGISITAMIFFLLKVYDILTIRARRNLKNTIIGLTVLKVYFFRKCCILISIN